jgi:hypothetical protein
MAEAFGLNDADRIGLPAFPFKMNIGVLEVRKARRVVFETVRKGPLQDPEIDLLVGEEPLGVQTLVPRISREGLGVSFDEPLPPLEREEPGHRRLELLERLLAFSPAGARRDQLSWDKREPVGDDLLSGEDIEDEECLPGRVDFNRLVPVFGGQLIVRGLNRDQGLIVSDPLLPADKRVLPKNRVPKRPQMRPLLFDENGWDLLGRLGNLPVRPPRQPVCDTGVRFLNQLKVPSAEEVTFDELHEIFDLALCFGIRRTADVEAELLFIDKVLKIFRIDDVPGVFADHHQPVLVDHEFFRPPAEIIETLEQETDDIQRPKRPALEDYVLVAAGRKKRREDVKSKAAAASVLTEIELHLPAKGQFGNFRVNPHVLVQSQRVRLDEIADVVAKRLFVARQNAGFFLQIVVNRRNLDRPKVVGLVNLEDLPPHVVESLVPEKMILTVGSVVLFSHGKEFGHGSGIKLQGLDDRAPGVSLPSESLHLFEHRFVDHSGSCKVFSYLTGVLNPWEFHLPQGWDFCLPLP